MTTAELVAAIGAHLKEAGITARELAREIRKDETAKPLAAELINTGAAKKKGEDSEVLKVKDAEIQQLKDALEDKETEIETLKAKPTEQQTAHEKEKQKLADRLAKAEQERDGERQGRLADAVSLARGRFLSSLKGRVDDFGLKAVENEYAGRFRARYDGDGDARRIVVDVLDEDGEPIEAPKGKQPESLLAEKAYEAVPDSNRVRQMNTGGGASGGGHAGVTREQLLEEKRRNPAFGVL